jgi:hypothetical protein
MPHYFSLEEADVAVQVIKPIMADVMVIRQEIIDNQPDAWPVIEKAAGNGGSKAASLLARSFERLDALVHKILDTGVLLKDINSGLFDFPAWRDDHEVYLCWKYGEPRIAYWHEIEAGFAGRQPIDTL